MRERYYMDKSGDLYDKNKMIMLDFGYSYDGVGCKKILDLLNTQNRQLKELKGALKELKEIGDYQAMRIEELQSENDMLRMTIGRNEAHINRIKKY